MSLAIEKRMPIGSRRWLRFAIGVLLGVSGPAQTTQQSLPLTKEYIYLGSRIIAIENNAVPIVVAQSGALQSTTANTPFINPLQAKVTAGSNPLQGVTVTFVAPATGASGMFAGTGTATTSVITDVAGIATASTFIANGTAGSYTVSASVAGATTSASFSLTNTATPSAGPGWYDPSWTSRNKITINHLNVSGTAALVNFPVLISTAVSAAKPDGSDILFTAGDGISKLNHEVESYAAGQLIAWVQVPQVSPTADISLYMYYGNIAAVDQQNKAGVWDANYKAVWHLAGTAVDSTGSANSGVISGARAAAGQLAGGELFVGVSSYIRLPQVAFGYPVTGSAATMAAITFETWFRTTAGGVMLGQDDGPLPNSTLLLGWTPALYVDFAGHIRSSLFWHGSRTAQIVSVNTYNDDLWHHVVGIYNKYNNG